MSDSEKVGASIERLCDITCRMVLVEANQIVLFSPRQLNGSSVHLRRRHQRLCGQPRDPLSKDMVKVSRVFIRVIGGDVSIGAPEGSQPGSVLRGGAYTRPLKTPRKNTASHTTRPARSGDVSVRLNLPGFLVTGLFRISDGASQPGWACFAC